MTHKGRPSSIRFVLCITEKRCSWLLSLAEVPRHRTAQYLQAKFLSANTSAGNTIDTCYLSQRTIPKLEQLTLRCMQFRAAMATRQFVRWCRPYFREGAGNYTASHITNRHLVIHGGARVTSSQTQHRVAEDQDTAVCTHRALSLANTTLSRRLRPEVYIGAKNAPPQHQGNTNRVMMVDRSYPGRRPEPEAWQL